MVLLARKCQYRPDQRAASVELMLSGCVKLPGDHVSHIDLTNNADLSILLDNIRAKVDGEPAKTAHHRKEPTFIQTTAEKATQAFRRIRHPKKLGPLWEGPFPI